MRRLMFVSLALALLAFAGNPVIAQPVSAAPSKRALRVQDRQDCTKQAAQQNIAKYDSAAIVRKCMADRQAARKKK